MNLFGRLLLSGLVAALSLGAPASAALKVGATAPLFDTQATLGTSVFDFNLADALKKGPVVLYFYPAAFTQGCTLEAHDFADHIDDYRKLGATVIGVSGDGIEKLQKFSVSECRSKFPVASDGDHKISTAYDALLSLGPVIYSNRTSYVIAKNGTIVYTYTSLDFSQHVANTLQALRTLEKR
jgi:peroxiredoxin